MNENFLRKMKCNFGRNTKASYFMTETLIVRKSLWEGEWFSNLFSVLKKNQLQFGRKWKISEILFITLFAQKNPERKTFRRHF